MSEFEVDDLARPKKKSTVANFKDAFKGSSKTAWIFVVILFVLIYYVFFNGNDGESQQARAGAADVAEVTRGDETPRNRGQGTTLPSGAPYRKEAEKSAKAVEAQAQERGESYIADILDEGVANGQIDESLAQPDDAPDYSNLLVGAGKNVQELRVDIAEVVAEKTGNELKQPRADPESVAAGDKTQILSRLSARYRVDAASARAATDGRIVYFGAETFSGATPEVPPEENTEASTDAETPVYDGPALSVGVGDYVYAYFVSGVDTDSPGPAILEIFGGELDGARLIAQYAVIGDRVHMQFGQLFLNGESHAVKLIAVDEAFTPGVSLNVNNRYLSRTLRFVAGVGGKAYAEALTQTETISDIDGVERTEETVLPDGKSQARFTLGTILGALLPNPEQALNQPAQHTAPPGYPVALMFIDAVSIPLAKGGANGQ